MSDYFFNRWDRKSVKGVASAIALLAILLLLSSNSLSPGQEISGVVLSSSTASFGRVYGSTQGVASVQLPTGKVVTAVVKAGGAPTPGNRVILLERSALWGGRAYEIIAVSK